MKHHKYFFWIHFPGKDTVRRPPRGRKWRAAFSIRPTWQTASPITPQWTGRAHLDKKWEIFRYGEIKRKTGICSRTSYQETVHGWLECWPSRDSPLIVAGTRSREGTRPELIRIYKHQRRKIHIEKNAIPHNPTIEIFISTNSKEHFQKMFKKINFFSSSKQFNKQWEKSILYKHHGFSSLRFANFESGIAQYDKQSVKDFRQKVKNINFWHGIEDRNLQEKKICMIKRAS